MRLHFAEIYWTAAGQRVFNVAINGTPVLANFDIFSVAGAANKAVIRVLLPADASGQIVVQYTTVTDNAASSGIEVRMLLPGTPTGLAATAGASQVALSWNASGVAANYNLKRAPTSGGPYTTIVNLSTTSYTDTSVTGGTTYYYVVSAVNVTGESANSSPVSATPFSWTRLNDTSAAITYGAGWSYSGSRGVGDYQNDVHFTVNNAAYAECTFTGTDVRFITETYSDEGAVDVYLDNVYQTTVNCNTATRQSQQAVYSATGLVAGPHTIKVVKISGTYMLVDAFEFANAAAATAPTITTQPQSQTIVQGQTATFSVAATGTAPLNYQWRVNGSTLAGATASSYTTSTAGSYDVIVSNVAGTVTSSPAILTVNVPPTITYQPVSAIIPAGSTATFSVTATGTAPLNYQWRRNGSTLAGATASSYTTGTAGTYDVIVSNVAGTVTSSPATLTVNQPPSVSAGTNQTINVLDFVNLAGSATDDGIPVASTIGWSKVSGPGTAAIGEPNQPVTVASFTMPGTYVLRLTAYDGQTTRSSDATIVVNAALTSRIVRAINVGGTTYTNTAGIVYEADSLFTGGSTNATTSSIAATSDATLYQRQRTGNFSYAIPVTNGDYRVTLQFAETQSAMPGQRVFDVLMEGNVVMSRLDIAAEVGSNAAFDWVTPVTVTNGVLDIVFQTATNSLQSAQVAGIIVDLLTPPADLPAAPTGLTATKSTQKGKIKLKWTASDRRDQLQRQTLHHHRWTVHHDQDRCHHDQLYRLRPDERQNLFLRCQRHQHRRRERQFESSICDRQVSLRTIHKR